MSAVVIPIAKEPAALQMLRETVEQMEEGEVTDFIIMKRTTTGRTLFTWFSKDSSYRILGMAQHLVFKMQRYMDRERE